MAKMNVNLLITKDYRKNDVFAAQKTKPIQTQSKPVLSAVEWANFRQEMPKMPYLPACLNRHYAANKKKTDDSSQPSVSTLPLPRIRDTQSLSATLFNNAKRMFYKLLKCDTYTNFSTFEQILAVHSDNFAGFDTCKLSFFLCQGLCPRKIELYNMA